MAPDATPAQIAAMTAKSVEAAKSRTEADQRLAVERLRATAAEAPAYTMGGVCYPASALLDAAAQIEALYTPAPTAPSTPQAAWDALIAQAPQMEEDDLDDLDRQALAETTDRSVWDWARQPITYTGRTRVLEYTRDRDAADYRPCQPGEVAQRLMHQREYRHGEQSGWETTHEETI
jgi:hypothetical protein